MGQLSVAIVDALGVDALERDWIDLQQRASSSVFQSWAWVGTWLRCQPTGAPIKCIRALDGERTVGLGLAGLSVASRHHFVRSRQWCLSETGNPLQDAITIEHNGLLAEKGKYDNVLRVMFATLSALRSQWDEFVVSGVDADAVQQYLGAAAASGLRGCERWRKPYYYVTADDVAKHGGDYLAALSGNTRYQIRRAFRDYEKTGSLSITRAKTREQAEAFFGHLVELHQAYWNARGQPGAFASTFARRFHTTLIHTRLSHGNVQLLRIAAGTDVIGYLYNLEHCGMIASYQSGFRYSDNPKLKPGLVSHALAIQEALSAGARTYDLLMGRQQYKEMLATRQGEMCWLVVQQPRVRFRVEHALTSWVRRARAARTWMRRNA